MLEATELNLVRRLISPMHEFGVLSGAAYLLDQALRKILTGTGLYLFDVMMQPITREPLLPPRLTRNLRTVNIGPGHPDLARMPARDDAKAMRFRQGAHCLGVYRRETFVGYVWLRFGDYDEDEVRCCFDLSRVEPAAWDFDLYVFPEHRATLGFPAVWHSVFEYLSRQGIDRSYSRVSRFNSASKRAHASLGSVRVGTVTIAKFWRLEVARSSMAPRFGVTWSRRPRYVVDDARRVGQAGARLPARSMVVPCSPAPSHERRSH